MKSDIIGAFVRNGTARLGLAEALWRRAAEIEMAPRFFAPDMPFPEGGYNIGDTLCFRRQHARNVRDVVCQLVADVDEEGHAIHVYERDDLYKLHAKDIEAWVKRTT